MQKKIPLLLIVTSFSLGGCKLTSSSEHSSASSASSLASSETATSTETTTEVTSEITSEQSSSVASEETSSEHSSEIASSREPRPEFTVTFVTNAPTLLNPIVTSYLEYPPVITNAPLVLVGWYFESNFVNLVNFPLVVTKNLTLYAKWGEVSDGLNYELNRTNDSYIVTSYAGNALQVTIPSLINNLPVVEIGEYAFYENGSIDYVALPSALKAIGFAAFKNVTRIESMIFPATLETIASDAFSGATNLKTVNLEVTKLQTLGDNSFEKTKIIEATLPNTITSIGARAFASNNLFTSLTVLSITPPYVYLNSFDSTSLNTIKVPSNSVATYKSSPYWESYKALIIAV